MAAKRENEGDSACRVVIETNPDRQVGTVHIEGVSVPGSEWESFLEYQALTTTAACEDVARVATQRPREKLADGSYVPDLRVDLSTAVVAVEVKPLAVLLGVKNLEKYSEIAQHYRSQGRVLHFLTEDQVDTEPRWGNVFLCRRYVSGSVSRTAEEFVNAKLEAGPCCIKEVVAASTGRASLVDIYTLIARKRLTIDWKVVLDPNALVSVAGRPFKGLSYEQVRHSGRFPDLLEELALGRRPKDQRRVALAKRVRPQRSMGDPWGFVGGIPSWDIADLG